MLTELKKQKDLLKEANRKLKLMDKYKERCQELERICERMRERIDEVRSDYQRQMDIMQISLEEKYKGESSEYVRIITNLTEEVARLKTDLEYNKWQREDHEVDVTDKNASEAEYKRRYEAKIAYQMKVIEDYKLKFKLYCTDLEKSLKLEYQKKEHTLMVQIKSLEF